MPMLLLLLLAASVSAEWVEISQQHRRATPAATNKIYLNYSLSEPWHRSGPRITNLGSVKRVQLQGKHKDKISVQGSSNKMTLSDSRFELGSMRTPNIKIMEDMETDKTKKKINVDHFEKYYENDVSIHSLSRISDLTKTKTDTDRQHELLNEKKQIPKRNKYQGLIITDEDINNAAETSYKSHNVNLDYPDAKHATSSSDVGISNDMQTVKNLIVNVEKFEQESDVKSNSGDGPRYSNTTHTTRKTTFFGNRDSLADTLYTSTPSVEHVTENKFHNIRFKQSKLENTANISKQRFKDTSDDYVGENVADLKNDDSSAETKPNPVQVIWKLMKLAADNISRHTRRSFQSRIRYLEDLQNNIAANIAERVDRAWPDDAAMGAKAGATRARRRREMGARGHVEFPSSESALMTISFLTFAVFLIKLVLQVIHTYKNKTMMVAPAVVAAVGRAAAAIPKPPQR